MKRKKLRIKGKGIMAKSELWYVMGVAKCRMKRAGIQGQKKMEAVKKNKAIGVYPVSGF